MWRMRPSVCQCCQPRRQTRSTQPELGRVSPRCPSLIGDAPMLAAIEPTPSPGPAAVRTGPLSLTSGTASVTPRPRSHAGCGKPCAGREMSNGRGARPISKDAVFGFYLPRARALAHRFAAEDGGSDARARAAELGLGRAVLGWQREDPVGFERFLRAAVTAELRSSERRRGVIRGSGSARPRVGAFTEGGRRAWLDQAIPRPVRGARKR